MADLRQLRTLEAVVRLRSFTRAGDELHVAQQAVSRTIAALEAELGVRLVERTTRAVEPTAAGRALAEDASRLLADADAALARARELGGAEPELLRLGMTPAFGPGEGGQVVERLRRALPGTAVSVVEVRPGTLRRQLLRGDVDVVLVRAVPANAEGLRARRLADVPAALAVPARHRWARRRKVALAELDDEPFLVWSRRSAGTDMLLDAVRRAGGTPRPVVSSVVGRGATTDVAAGKAVALVPAGEPAAPGVRLVRLDPPAGLPVQALVRAGERRRLVTRALAALG